jgi:hypothetical protein
VRLVLRGEHFQHHLGGHHRAAQVHQDQNAVVAVHGVHRSLYFIETCAQPSVVEATGCGDGRVALCAHLAGQCANTVGQFLAVGYYYDANQIYLLVGGSGRPRISRINTKKKELVKIRVIRGKKAFWFWIVQVRYRL